MTLKIIKCEQSSINCFLRKVTEEGFGTIISLENCKKSRKASIVLGKIVKFIHKNPVEKCVKLIVREVLPDGTYGVKFKAVIQDTLSKLVVDAELCTGDRLGFFEPNIFNNPAFQPQEDVAYVLQIGGNKQSVMWYAKKQYILALPPKSKNSDEQVQEKETPTKETQKTTNNKVVQGTNSNKTNSLDSRLKPQTQPSSSSNSSRYIYKKLSRVKYDALHGDLQRVNIFAVVSEISKGLSKTTTGKFTIICKLVDDSIAVDRELINFDLHFFTPESNIISGIEQGDIVRLHRVKMELYMDDVDGRIFNSQDIVVFKKNSPVSEPISMIKNLSLSDEEKKTILNLKCWYKEKYGTFLNSMVNKSDVTLLSSIKSEGDYNLVCKVVSKPVVTGSKIILCVSDGSMMTSIAPGPCCHPHAKYDLPNCSGHLVTDIDVFERLDVYSKFKVNDYIFLRSVKATKVLPCENNQSDQLHLAIPSFSFPMVLESKVDKILQIESRLQDWNEDQLHNRKETNSDDSKNMQCEIQRAQDVPPSNEEAAAEPSSNKTQVTSNCETYGIKHQSNQRSMNLRNKSTQNKCISSVCDSKACEMLGDSKEERLVNKDPGGEQITTKEPCGQKLRKQLFTENYTDLSDATDELSEVLVQAREVGPSQVVMSPDSLSLERLMELVKSKYCAPRRLPVPSTSNLPEVVTQHSSTGTEETGKNNTKTKDSRPTGMQSAIVKLVKLSDEECENLNHRQHRKSKRRKSTDEMKFNVSDKNLEDASTVVNLTVESQENRLNKSQRNKRLRLDSESADVLKRPVGNDVVSRDPERITNKVSSWLTQHEEKNAAELDLATVHQLIFNSDHQETDNLSSFITSHVRRLKVFLLQVVPDPIKEAIDLISGHCLEGCQQMFLFSTIHWKEVDGQLLPFCPSCQRTQLDKQLTLIFMLQLNIMDRNGNHESALVCREHGEVFFGCSVQEFVSEPAVRRSRVQLLVDNTVLQSSRSSPFTSPLLDLSVVAVSNILCVVNSRLKLPPDP